MAGGHIAVDYENPDGELTVYLRHIPATGQAVTINPHEKHWKSGELLEKKVSAVSLKSSGKESHTAPDHQRFGCTRRVSSTRAPMPGQVGTNSRANPRVIDQEVTRGFLCGRQPGRVTDRRPQ